MKYLLSELLPNGKFICYNDILYVGINGYIKRIGYYDQIPNKQISIYSTQKTATKTYNLTNHSAIYEHISEYTPPNGSYILCSNVYNVTLTMRWVNIISSAHKSIGISLYINSILAGSDAIVYESPTSTGNSTDTLDVCNTFFTPINGGITIYEGSSFNALMKYTNYNTLDFYYQIVPYSNGLVSGTITFETTYNYTAVVITL